MEDLITWLRGVLDADESAAKAVRRLAWESDGRITVSGDVAGVWVLGDDGDPVAIAQCATAEDGEGVDPRVIATHIALHDPEQVLADVAAKRAILDAYLPEDGDPHPGLPCINYEGQNPEHYSEWDTCSRHIKANETLIRQDFVIRLLASAYRHRPGWRDSWGE